MERQLGPYRLERQLAVGGMAEIYVASATGPGGFEKRVALKVIHPNFSADPTFMQMLVDEAKLAVQLQHPNIVQTLDLGRKGGNYYIAMELIDGIDLFQLLRRTAEENRYLPFDVVAYVASGIAAGLDYAHRKRSPDGRELGIVHRDISPQNVLVGYAGEVKLVDFGIAKAAQRSGQTGVGVIKGKGYYMSPEQARGLPVDARTDIFCAGIVLYEMLVGEALYRAGDFEELLELVRKSDIAPPNTRRRDVPAGLEKIAMRALEREPAARYQNAGEMGADLAAWLRSASPDFTPARLERLLSEIIDPEAPSDSFRVRRAGAITAEAYASGLRDENSLLFSLERIPPAGEPSASRGIDEHTAPIAPARKEVITKPERPARPPEPLSEMSAPRLAAVADFPEEADATIVDPGVAARAQESAVPSAQPINVERPRTIDMTEPVPRQAPEAAPAQRRKTAFWLAPLLLAIVAIAALSVHLASPEVPTLGVIEARTAAGSGTIHITSTPAGAEVFVNGARRGVTPLNLQDLPLTTDAQVELRMNGFRTERHTLPWPPTHLLELSLTLSPAAR